MDARIRAWLTLQLIEGVGPRRLHALLTTFGSPEAVLEASVGSLARIVPGELAAAIRAGPDLDRLAQCDAWLAVNERGLVAWDDADYPPSLLTIPDPPPVLFVLGRRELLCRPAIAIVGSRNATAQGLETAEAFAAALGDAGLTIVSGLALGIDAAAHRGGLATASSSVAVIGTGPDRVYPPRNRALAHELAVQGAVVSEFPPGTAVVRGQFPRRNRVISGLARGVLVVEASLESGSLITARLAAEQGRDVFAIPGSIHSPLSKGCHRLIKEGAKLVETADDVLGELGWPAPGPTDPLFPAAQGPGEAIPPAGRDGRVLTALGHDPAAVETLCTRTGLPVEAVRASLVALELAGAVAALPGDRYQRQP